MNKGSDKEIGLGNSEYSYSTELVWNSYKERLEDKSYDISSVSFYVNEDAYIFDTVYIEDGICTMSDYLEKEQIQTDGNNKWGLETDKIYVVVHQR